MRLMTFYSALWTFALREHCLCLRKYPLAEQRDWPTQKKRWIAHYSVLIMFRQSQRNRIGLKCVWNRTPFLLLSLIDSVIDCYIAANTGFYRFSCSLPLLSKINICTLWQLFLHLDRIGTRKETHKKKKFTTRKLIVTAMRMKMKWRF